MWTLRHPLLDGLRGRRRDAYVHGMDRVMRRAYSMTVQRFGPVVISLYSSRTDIHAPGAGQAATRTTPIASLLQRLSIHRERIERLLSVHRERSRVLASAAAPNARQPAGESEAAPSWRVQPQAMASRIERQIVYPRISLTMVRTQPALGTPKESTPHHPSTPADRNRATRLAASARQAAVEAFSLPAQELSRVTEHVIQTLDRRVLSYRERTGQL